MEPPRSPGVVSRGLLEELSPRVVGGNARPPLGQNRPLTLNRGWCQTLAPPRIPENPQVFQGFRPRPPRWPPEPSSWSQDGPQTPQVGAKMAHRPPNLNLEPRCPQDPQLSGFWCQLGAPRPSKNIEKTMKMMDVSMFFAMLAKCNFRANLTPNLEPRRLNLEPRPPNLEAKWPQDPRTWSQDGPKTPQLGAKMTPRPPNLGKNGTKTP